MSADPLIGGAVLAALAGAFYWFVARPSADGLDEDAARRSRWANTGLAYIAFGLCALMLLMALMNWLREAS